MSSNQVLLFGFDRHNLINRLVVGVVRDIKIDTQTAAALIRALIGEVQSEIFLGLVTPIETCIERLLLKVAIKDAISGIPASLAMDGTNPFKILPNLKCLR